MDNFIVEELSFSKDNNIKIIRHADDNYLITRGGKILEKVGAGYEFHFNPGVLNLFTLDEAKKIVLSMYE